MDRHVPLSGVALFLFLCADVKEFVVMPFYLFAVSIAFLMVGCLGADTSDPKRSEPMASDMGTAGSSTRYDSEHGADGGAVVCR